MLNAPGIATTFSAVGASGKAFNGKIRLRRNNLDTLQARQILRINQSIVIRMRVEPGFQFINVVLHGQRLAQATGEK